MLGKGDRIDVFKNTYKQDTKNYYSEEGKKSGLLIFVTT